MSAGLIPAAPEVLASLAHLLAHPLPGHLLPGHPLLALVQPGEYWFLPPICLAIALVSAASHREDLRTILRSALRAWLMLLVGIALFTLVVTSVFGWLLP